MDPVDPVAREDAAVRAPVLSRVVDWLDPATEGAEVAAETEAKAARANRATVDRPLGSTASAVPWPGSTLRSSPVRLALPALRSKKMAEVGAWATLPPPLVAIEPTH